MRGQDSSSMHAPFCAAAAALLAFFVYIFFYYFCRSPTTTSNCKWPQKWRTSDPAQLATPIAALVVVNVFSHFPAFILLYLFFVATTLWHVCKSWARPRNSHVGPNKLVNWLALIVFPLWYSFFLLFSREIPVSSQQLGPGNTSIIKQLISQRIPQKQKKMCNKKTYIFQGGALCNGITYKTLLVLQLLELLNALS